MERLDISFPADLRKQLDAEAEREGVSRSALIQKAVRVYLQRKRFAGADAILAQGYDELNEEARRLGADFFTADNEIFQRHISQQERS
jgi:metal-responsive CopG/Arc/MetJ family transcriptional regulator